MKKNFIYSIIIIGVLGVLLFAVFPLVSSFDLITFMRSMHGR